MRDIRASDAAACGCELGPNRFTSGRALSAARLLKAGWFPLLVALLVIFLQIIPGPGSFDDAYITFRYARNLVDGIGFVYNPSERVLGTTTPLYTLLLAAASLVTSCRDFPVLSIALNALFDVGTILLLRPLLASVGVSKTPASLISIAYALNPLRIGVALGGMETPVAVFWLVAASYWYVARQRHRAAAICCGLAFLTRPDTILLPLLFALHRLVFHRRVPFREGAIFAAVIVPWLAFAWLYYGSPVPQSITAKTQSYLLHPYHAIATLLGYVASRSPWITDWPLWAIGVSLGAAFWLYGIGARFAMRKNTHALVLALFPPLYVVGLSVANPLLFVWYYPPLVILLDAIILVGFQALLVRAKPLVRALSLVLFIVALLTLEWTGADQPGRGWTADLRQHEEVYESAAVLLQESIPPESVIALPEIGILGYAFPEATIIDTVGLVTPQAVPFLLSGPVQGQTLNYAIAPEAIEALEPDYVITLEIFARPTLLQSSAFLSSYRLIRVFETNALGSDGLLVFERSGSQSGMDNRGDL